LTEMRQKDAEVMAMVLGTELRTCTDSEREGLLAAIVAIDGHMRHVHPEYDPLRFVVALNNATRTAGEIVDLPDLRKRMYVEGLPVAIDVTDAGVVAGDVDASEAAGAAGAKIDLDHPDAAGSHPLPSDRG
jgi:hypothetical protein